MCSFRTVRDEDTEIILSCYIWMWNSVSLSEACSLDLSKSRVLRIILDTSM